MQDRHEDPGDAPRRSGKVLTKDSGDSQVARAKSSRTGKINRRRSKSLPQTRYTVEIAEQAVGLLAAYDQLRQEAPSAGRAGRLRALEADVMRITGAPSITGARAGVRAFLAAKANLRAFKKPRPRTSRRSKPVLAPKWITVVSGGLPTLGRRG